MLDGVAWGIVPSKTTTKLNGNKNGPVVNDAVVFTLTSPSSLSSSDITGVEFAYGTGNGEGGFKSTTSATTQATTVTVPAPPSAFLLGFGGLSCLLYWCKRRRLPAAA